MEETKTQNLKTFIQKDVFPDMELIDVAFEDRLTGKSIVTDSDGKIAFVGASVSNIYTLPGGGIDKNESIEDGIIREAKEEIGCDIKISSMLGVIDDYRNRDKKHCISYCAIAEIIGEKGSPNLTEEEKKNGLHVIWLSKNEAYKILKEEKDKVLKGEINYYNTAFNVLRDFEFVKNFLGK
jgi:8-oxo-dGTP diphosphatase